MSVGLLDRKTAGRPARPLSRMARWWLSQGFTIEECREMYYAMLGRFDTMARDPGPSNWTNR